MSRYEYTVQRGDAPATKIVARYRPLDLSYLPSSHHVGMLWVGENGAVWIVLRSHAWLIGVLPVGVYRFNRNRVVRWAKTQLEEWHRNQQAQGWQGEHGRVYVAIRKERLHA